METFSALLAIDAGNSPVPGEFQSQRPVARSFDAFFDLRLNTRMSKQPRRWRFETPLHPLWRHCNKNKSEFEYNKTQPSSSVRATYGMSIVRNLEKIDLAETASSSVK